mgnify:FL=1
MRPKILYSLFSNIISIKGIGPKYAKLIERLCGKYLVDLIFHKPAAYIDRRNNPKICDLKNDTIATLIVKIDSHTPAFNKRMPYRITCSDESGQISIVYFNMRGPYIKKILPIGSKRVISGKIETYKDSFQMTHPHHIADIKEFDKIKSIECIYPLTAGLTSRSIQKAINSSLEITDELPEWIPESVLKSNKWISWSKSVKKLHNPDKIYENHSSPHLERLVFDELLSHQLTIRLIKNKINKIKGNKLEQKGILTEKLKTLLDFKLTNDQIKSIDEISDDLNSENKMLRLLQGDVGSGKTIVALFSILQSIENSKRSVLMAPTELLAEQHFNTINMYANELGLTCSLITSSTRKNHNFDSDILIGTHALFQESVEFVDIGIVVIDEQHKFGVHQRILLSEKVGNECDILLMTATPIPRTLELASYGDMDISKIHEKPKNRRDITTKSININKVEDLKLALRKKIKNNEKIYWVCPLVDDSEKLALQSVNSRLSDLKNYFNEGEVDMVHGQMSQDQKNKIMANFSSGNTKILIATSVIEVGIDDPDATVMIIENAERYGLSQLHQLRGRVGRGKNQSSCILLFYGPLSETAKRRITIMKETNDGFKIAEEDLDIRGSGEILGSRQSGVPEFKLSNLDIHKHLLEMAREEALNIVNTDPTLKTDRGKALKILLHLFKNEVAIDYLKSG